VVYLRNVLFGAISILNNQFKLIRKWCVVRSAAKRVKGMGRGSKKYWWSIEDMADDEIVKVDFGGLKDEIEKLRLAEKEVQKKKFIQICLDDCYKIVYKIIPFY